MTVTVLVDSYATEAEFTAYASARGVTITGDETQLLIKAMDWLESNQFGGYKRDLSQPLKWPRYSGGDSFSDPWQEYPLDANSVPMNIKNAQMACALIIDGGGDPLGTINQQVKREKVDVIEVEYMEGSAAGPIYPQLTTLISPFLGGGSGTGFMVSRG